MACPETCHGIYEATLANCQQLGFLYAGYCHFVYVYVQKYGSF